MKIVTLAAVIVSWALVNASGQQEVLLDDAAVEAAIKSGQSKKYSHLTSDCVATAGFGAHMAAGAAGGVQPIAPYNVTVTGAEGLIATLAEDAKRLYKIFGLADVTTDMRRLDMLYVSAIPHSPKRSGNTFDYAAPIESVALKSKVNKDAFAPAADLKLTPLEWKNLVGGTIAGTSAIAQFKISDVRAFPAGDFDVVLVTTAGERRCKVGTKDRAKILPAPGAARGAYQLPAVHPSPRQPPPFTPRSRENTRGENRQ